MQNYLSPTRFLNYEHPAFDRFTASVDRTKNQTESAVDLYYLVRDSFLYDPYHLDLTHEGLIASNVLLKQRAWCVEKASILAACARKFGIPSQLGYAVVTNHIGTEKLTAYLKRKEIVFHGFVALFLDDKWVKCTPAFDRRMCAVSGVSSLDWDGKSDSLFQEFEKGNRFMEYMHFYGLFDDVPIELMNQEMKRYYPHLFEQSYDSKQFSFKHLTLTEME
jgi:transglutaminase-like putative cysteine protease